jgi:hypothetical protein
MKQNQQYYRFLFFIFIDMRNNNSPNYKNDINQYELDLYI